MPLTLIPEAELDFTPQELRRFRFLKWRLQRGACADDRFPVAMQIRVQGCTFDLLAVPEGADWTTGGINLAGDGYAE